MIYTELTKKAACLAFQAHFGQTDRAGFPYIMHPIHVAEQMTTEDTCVVALLHDVLEDTDVTAEDLRREGFTDAQIEAVKLITHAEGTDYMDYVRGIKKNEIAKTVKLADLAHNMDRTRIRELSEKDEARYRKYQAAKALLLEEEN